jgi:DNA-binding transcriptional ArsR family regulator
MITPREAGGSAPVSRDELSLEFTALAHPARRAILRRLVQGEATVRELARPLDLSLPNVSRHIKVLREAGLIVQRRVAQERPCRLNPRRLERVASWFEPYESLWETRYDRLAAQLSASTRRSERVARESR